ALLSAIQAAATSDDGAAIVSSIVAAFRERGALLPAIDTIERIGLTGRAIARRRAETTLIKDVPLDTLRSLDRLLEVDPSIGQTRFHWLRSAPEAPSASNLVGLTERIAFLRRLEIDPTLQ
ncbi:Tn3 family transposase, partial [Agrobacterium sp. MCAB5]